MMKKKKTNRKKGLNVKPLKLTFILRLAKFVIQIIPIILTICN